MELKEDKPLVLHFDTIDPPRWFLNAWTHAIPSNWWPTLEELFEKLHGWFEHHYDATCVFEKSWTITFPNKETYLQCLLTWS